MCIEFNLWFVCVDYSWWSLRSVIDGYIQDQFQGWEAGAREKLKRACHAMTRIMKLVEPEIECREGWVRRQINGVRVRFAKWTIESNRNDEIVFEYLEPRDMENPMFQEDWLDEFFRSQYEKHLGLETDLQLFKKLHVDILNRFFYQAIEETYENIKRDLELRGFRDFLDYSLLLATQGVTTRDQMLNGFVNRITLESMQSFLNSEFTPLTGLATLDRNWVYDNTSRRAQRRAVGRWGWLAVNSFLEKAVRAQLPLRQVDEPQLFTLNFIRRDLQQLYYKEVECFLRIGTLTETNYFTYRLMVGGVYGKPQGYWFEGAKGRVYDEIDD